MTGSLHYQRGSSLPETALIIAVVLALVFGIIDFGRAMYTYAFVANSARMAARWAIVRGSQSCINTPNLDHCNASSTDIQTYVQSQSVGLTNVSNITATGNWLAAPPLCPTTGSKAPGCYVAVTVSYPFKFMLPYLPVGPTYTMSSTSKMVISQ